MGQTGKKQSPRQSRLTGRPYPIIRALNFRLCVLNSHVSQANQQPMCYFHPRSQFLACSVKAAFAIYLPHSVLLKGVSGKLA